MFAILLYAFAGLFLLWMILLSLGVRRMWINVVLFALEATLAYTIIGNLCPRSNPGPRRSCNSPRCDAGAVGQSRRAVLRQVGPAPCVIRSIRVRRRAVPARGGPLDLPSASAPKSG